jgi:hypothetical protein
MTSSRKPLTEVRNLVKHYGIPAGRATLRSASAVAALLLGILACNVPGLNPTSPAPGDAPGAESTLSAGAATETPVPLDPFTILDSYPSLAGTREFLDRLTFDLAADITTARSGRQLLEWILVERRYDPRASNRAKQELFSELEQTYFMPNAGAKTYLINVATGLFAEAHHFYPWSLRDYSPQQIQDLFIQDDSLRWESSGLFRGDLPPGRS